MTRISRPEPARFHAALLSMTIIGMTLPCAAQAGLGETVASVQHDHVALHGTAMTITPMAAYDVHQITTAESLVREYVTRDGRVFAVTWSGRTAPDLSILLGTRYAVYAEKATPRRGNHKVLALATDDLVMHVTKLPRGFAGEAHVPTLLPAGVSAQDIR